MSDDPKLGGGYYAQIGTFVLYGGFNTAGEFVFGLSQAMTLFGTPLGWLPGSSDA
jgi:hypothetical protein